LSLFLMKFIHNIPAVIVMTIAFSAYAGPTASDMRSSACPGAKQAAEPEKRCTQENKLPPPRSSIQVHSEFKNQNLLTGLESKTNFKNKEISQLPFDPDTEALIRKNAAIEAHLKSSSLPEKSNELKE
jgi:hypothetical protein